MFGKDHPIQSAKDDALGRARFAQALGEAILSQEPQASVVIGLFGQWGSGKSSIINMAVEHIESQAVQVSEKARPIVVRFNPWYFSDQNQLLSRFFDSLLAGLNKPNYAKKLQKASRLMKTYAAVFKPLGLVPTAGGKIAGLLSKGGETVSTIADWASSRLGDLDKQRESLDKMLAEQPHKIIVAIDDIDRLTGAETRQVFQLVKSLANFPNATYLLAFDREVVEKHLAEFHQGNGQAFLEKIVQVPFTIPQTPTDEVHRLLKSKLYAFLQQSAGTTWNPGDLQNIFHFGIKRLVRNLRDVIRYTNVVSFNLNVVKGEISPIDVFGITCIQVFEPGVFEALRTCRTLLTEKSDENSQGRRLGQQEGVTLLNSIVTQQKRGSEEPLVNILRVLFPKVEALQHAQGHLNFEPNPEWRIQKRLCWPSNFDLFFRTSLPRGEFSSADVERICSLAVELPSLVTFVEQIRNEGRTRQFLETINQYAGHKRVPADSATNLVSALIDLGDSICDSTVDGQDDDVFEIDLPRLLALTLTKLCSCILDEETEREVVKKAIQGSGRSPFTLAYLIRHKHFNREELKADVKAKIRVFAKNGTLFKHSRVMAILAAWEELGEKAEVTAALRQIEDSDEYLLCYLGCYLHYDAFPPDKMGYYTPRPPKMNGNSLKGQIDVPKAIERMTALRNSARFAALTAREKDTLTAFLNPDSHK